MGMTHERLAEIEARAAKATAGPWASRGGEIWSPTLGRYPSIIVETDGGLYWRQDPRSWDEREKSPGPDQDFIAHAREDVPALIAEVKRLRDLLDSTQEDADKYRHMLERAEILP